MKLFFGEFKANYSKYLFPYQVWLLREPGDETAKIYNAGFLPVRSLPNVYYLCRSVRVNLSQFELSSENRRILRKTEAIKSEIIKFSEFNYTSAVQKFCVDYAKTRLGREALPVAAIRSIFTGQVYNSVLVFKDDNKTVGYAVCFITEKLMQYAHAFYDLKYIDQSLGARMMLEAISFSKKQNLEYIYLGTCYEKSALYKTEFKGVEFFTGFGWSSNLEELKSLIKEGRGKISLKQMILNSEGVRVTF